jgi:hypothetical protein
MTPIQRRRTLMGLVDQQGADASYITPAASCTHITGTREQRHMGRSGDRYELDIPEFNWNVGADAMRQDAHTSPTARITS